MADIIEYSRVYFAGVVRPGSETKMDRVDAHLQRARIYRDMADPHTLVIHDLGRNKIDHFPWAMVTTARVIVKPKEAAHEPAGDVQASGQAQGQSGQPQRHQQAQGGQHQGGRR